MAEKKLRVVLDIALRYYNLKDAEVQPEDLVDKLTVHGDIVCDGVVISRDIVNGYDHTDEFFFDEDNTYIVSTEIIES